MLESNLIVIRGCAGCYKSSMAALLANSFNDKKVCYIDLEGNSHINLKENVTVINSSKDLDINSVINENDVIIIDYLELLDYSIEKLTDLKDLVRDNNKTLILVTCKSSDSKDTNPYKDIAEITINLEK